MWTTAASFIVHKFCNGYFLYISSDLIGFERYFVVGFIFGHFLLGYFPCCHENASVSCQSGAPLAISSFLFRFLACMRFFEQLQ